MGTLYIVSGPIGNLKDITARALETLKAVNYVLAEDTRVTGKLLKNYGIEKRMVSFNDFNEEIKLGQVVSDLKAGNNVALVSDAGTPLISDPGFKLVRETIGAGVKVESIPGPSAVITALTVSGLPPDKFLFIGYIPKKDGKKRQLFSDLVLIKPQVGTVIFLESPHRIVKTLVSMTEIFGDIEVVICRELTKLHEEVIRDRVSGIISRLQNKPAKGELTILF